MVCVCLCVRTISPEPNNLCPRHLSSGRFVCLDTVSTKFAGKVIRVDNMMKMLLKGVGWVDQL